MVSLQVATNFVLKLWWAQTWPNPLMLAGMIGLLVSILAVNAGWNQMERRLAPAVAAAPTAPVPSVAQP